MKSKYQNINKTSLGSLTLRMEQFKVTAGEFYLFCAKHYSLFKAERSKMPNLSKPTRRSSAGSSLSSLSPDEENPTRISRQFSLTEPNQRLTKDNLAKIGNRQTKVVNHASKKEKRGKNGSFCTFREMCFLLETFGR